MIIVKQVTINQMVTVATHSAPSFASAGSVFVMERARIESFALPIGGGFEVKRLNASVLLETTLPAIDSTRGPLRSVGC